MSFKQITNVLTVIAVKLYKYFVKNYLVKGEILSIVITCTRPR